MSAPPRSRESMTSTVSLGSGYPAVMKATKAGRSMGIEREMTKRAVQHGACGDRMNRLDRIRKREREGGLTLGLAVVKDLSKMGRHGMNVCMKRKEEWGNEKKGDRTFMQRVFFLGVSQSASGQSSLKVCSV